MNQIPNIEEEFDARTFIKKARKQNWKNGGVLARDDDELVEELENAIHHQLQKARHDWLREEIVRLEGMKKRHGYELPTNDLCYSEHDVNNSHDLALQTIIDRYNEELNQGKI